MYCFVRVCGKGETPTEGHVLEPLTSHAKMNIVNFGHV